MKINGWVVAGMLGIMGCDPRSVVGYSSYQVDAVDAVIDYTCEAYARCGLNKTLQDRIECEKHYYPIWNESWPVDECDERINKEKTQHCLDTIKATPCDNFQEQLNISFEQCSMTDVCSGR